MNKKIKWIGIVVMLILVGMILGIATFLGNIFTITSISTSTSTKTSTLTTTIIISTTSITSSSTSTPPPSTALPTGVVVGEFNVTVKEARWIKALDSYSSSYTNGSFLLVSLSVENIGKSQRLFGVVGEYFGATGTAEIAVIDSKGYEYPSFSKVPLPTSTIEWTVLPQMVGPKISKEWIIAFDIPLRCPRSTTRIMHVKDG